MTQISGGEKKNLVFEIISARIQEEVNERKYVIYNLQVRHLSGNDDLRPSLIERRYSQFLNLYNSLKIEYPELLVSIDFPKKVLLGNFDNDLISTRSIGFETLLKHIAANSLLRNSKSLVIFLQEPEVTQAKELMAKNLHGQFPY
ncbi:hypothetical protein WA026_022054 [Henosepilachna vigintioctopunctata]|uniref:PX domain-containing protein n=1 Tax=Henosepilachna vigintioctopunctata TaxID=420089 RepID=A0AAW1UBD4_9CUCU